MYRLLAGQKKCNGKCIPIADCCKDEECEGGKTCSDGQCACGDGEPCRTHKRRPGNSGCTRLPSICGMGAQDSKVILRLRFTTCVKIRRGTRCCCCCCCCCCCSAAAASHDLAARSQTGRHIHAPCARCSVQLSCPCVVVKHRAFLPAGDRQCGNACIPNERCCSDDDCGGGKICDPSTKKCRCPKGETVLNTPLPRRP